MVHGGARAQLQIQEEREAQWSVKQMTLAQASMRATMLKQALGPITGVLPGATEHAVLQRLVAAEQTATYAKEHLKPRPGLDMLALSPRASLRGGTAMPGLSSPRGSQMSGSPLQSPTRDRFAPPGSVYDQGIYAAAGTRSPRHLSPLRSPRTAPSGHGPAGMLPSEAAPMSKRAAAEAQYQKDRESLSKDQLLEEELRTGVEDADKATLEKQRKMLAQAIETKSADAACAMHAGLDAHECMRTWHSCSYGTRSIHVHTHVSNMCTICMSAPLCLCLCARPC